MVSLVFASSGFVSKPKEDAKVVEEKSRELVPLKICRILEEVAILLPVLLSSGC